MTNAPARKIAAVTDDGTSISAHFGRAAYFLVATVEDGRIVESEMRPKEPRRHESGHGHDSDHHHSHEAGGGHWHGAGPDAQAHHRRMAESIQDCEALLSRGMGHGAYQDLEAHGIRPVLTDIAPIEQAVAEYIAGRIIDHVDRLH